MYVCLVQVGNEVLLESSKKEEGSELVCVPLTPEEKKGGMQPAGFGIHSPTPEPLSIHSLTI